MQIQGRKVFVVKLIKHLSYRVINYSKLAKIVLNSKKKSSIFYVYMFCARESNLKQSLEQDFCLLGLVFQHNEIRVN